MELEILGALRMPPSKSLKKAPLLLRPISSSSSSSAPVFFGESNPRPLLFSRSGCFGNVGNGFGDNLLMVSSLLEQSEIEEGFLGSAQIFLEGKKERREEDKDGEENVE